MTAAADLVNEVPANPSQYSPSTPTDEKVSLEKSQSRGTGAAAGEAKPEATIGDFVPKSDKPMNLDHLDEGAKLMIEFEGQLDDVTEEDYKKLLRKIDWHLMPLMLLLYWIQFSDKTSLGNASILGIKKDNDLTTDRYNNCSSFFYITYLAFEYLCNLVLQRFRTGRVLTAAAFSWAVLLLCHMACNSYGGLLTLRLLLGVTEGIVTPGFLLMVSAYYKVDEQPTRTGLWFLMNGFATIFNSLVAYGSLNIKIGSWQPWRAFFLILGSFGLLTAVLYFFFFPDTPAHAWFLSRKERAMALKRVAGNQSGSKNKNFKKDQLIEALTDIKVWLFVFYAFCSNIPNSMTQQRSIILTQFGFSTLETTLLNIPTGVIEMTTIPLGTWLARRFKKSTAHVMMGFTIPSLVGAAMLIGLPQDQKVARLIGVYLSPINTVGFVLSLAWNSASNAGTTKKVTANAMLLVGYCLGNILGPLMWKSKYSPQNVFPWSIILVCYFLCIPTAYAIWFLFKRENARRDALLAAAGISDKTGHEIEVDVAVDSDKTAEEAKGGHHHLDTAFLDLTDKQNVNFRYPL